MVKETFSGWIRLALALSLRVIVRASLTKTGGGGNFQTGTLHNFIRHSVLSAFIGEMDAARRAGITAAKNAEIARAKAAIPRAMGSQLETP